MATLFGYQVFQDFPSTLRLTGIAIIIGAGLYIIHRERVIAEQLITSARGFTYSMRQMQS